MEEILDLLSLYHNKGWVKDFKIEKASLEGAYLNLLNTMESEDMKNERVNCHV